MNIRCKMKRGIRRGAFAILASVVGFGLFGGSTADAALLGLVANQTLNFGVTPAVDTAGLPTGAQVYYSGLEPLLNNPGSTLTGTLQSWVYYDTGTSGPLDFVYEVGNDPGSTDSYTELSITPFGTFTTNVGYEQTGVDPSGADRLGNNIVDWYFTGIGPGANSDYLVVQTNALSYKMGSGEVIDDGSAGASATVPFGVGAGMPEPGSATLAIAACGLILRRRRQRS
jgi:hypothetical protein